MALRINDPLRNSLLGTEGFDKFNNGKLSIYSGTQPAGSNAAPTGTLLVEITLPADACGSSSAGVFAKSGTWEDTSADATGTAGYFRLKETGDDDSLDGNFDRMDGDITITSGGGELELDSLSITIAQTVTINTFSVTQPAS